MNAHVHIPSPLSADERTRRLAQLPNPGAIALLELDDRLTGANWRHEVMVAETGKLGGWTDRHGDTYFADESTHTEFARRCAARGLTVRRVITDNRAEYLGDWERDAA